MTIDDISPANRRRRGRTGTFRLLALTCWMACAAARSEPSVHSGTVSIRALDASGQPARGGRAWFPEDSPKAAGEDGLVRLDWQGEMPAFACVDAPGHEARPVLLDALAAAAPVDVGLPRGGRVTGSLASRRGSPPVGARIRVLAPEGAAACAGVVSADERAAFVVDHLPRARVILRVSGGPGFLDLDIEADLRREAMVRGAWRLHPASRVTLALGDASGRPIAGAMARILPGWRDGLERPLPAKESLDAADIGGFPSTPTGVIALPPLPRDARVQAALTHPGFAPRLVHLPTDQPDALLPVSLSIGGTVSVRAVDGAGMPLPGASLRLESEKLEDLLLLEPPPPSAADGMLVARHVPAGLMTAELRAIGMAPARIHPVTVTDGVVTDLGDVALTPGAELGGTVSDESGPVPDADVLIRFPSGARVAEIATVTDGEGAFVVQGLPIDVPLRVSASAPGYLETVVERARPGVIDLELARCGSLSGTVVDDETGEPVPHFRVLARSDEAEPYDQGIPSEGSDGRFSYERLAAGQYRIRVDSPAHEGLSREAVAVAPGKPVELELRLRRGASLEGFVSLEEDPERPIGGARIVARMAGGMRRETISDAEGAFRLEGLSGSVTLVARWGALASRSLVLPSIEGVAAPVELVLRPAAAIEGVVRGPDGDGIAGAEISVEGQGETLSRSDGAYRLEGLSAGFTEVRKTDRPGSMEGLEVARLELREGATARHDFGTGAKLWGFVRFRGQAIPGVEVTLHEARWEESGGAPALLGGIARGAAVSGEDGRYEVRGLETGTWMLACSWQGRRFTRPVETRGLGDQRFDIVVPDLEVAGIVTDPATGRPVPGALVSARPDGAGGQVAAWDPATGRPSFYETAPLAQEITAPDGTFALLLPEAGRVVVEATRDGFVGTPASRWSGDVQGPRNDLVLQLSSRAVARVRVVDASTGESLRGVHLWVEPGEGDPLLRADASGAYELSVPARQPFTLLVSAEGHAPAILGNQRVEPGAPREIEAALGPGGSAELLIPPGGLLVAGLQLAGLDVILRDGSNLATHPVTQWSLARHAVQLAEDRWLLQHLPAEPCLFVLRRNGRSAEATPGAGAPVTVDLR